VTYHFGNTQAAKQKGYHPLVGSDIELYRYHYRHGRRITRTYGATTIHYSYKKAS
jgi:hypothetical protein